MKNQPTASKLPLLNVTQSTQSEKKHLPSYKYLTELMVKVLKGSVEKFLEQYPSLKGIDWLKTHFVYDFRHFVIIIIVIFFTNIYAIYFIILFNYLFKVRFVRLMYD